MFIKQRGSKRLHKLLLVLTALTLLVFHNFALAQTREMEHQKATDPKSQVHAVGTAPDASKSFIEKYAPPEIISSFGDRIDWLFRYTSWTAFVFFVIMALSLVYFVLVYRARPGHSAYYTHGLSKGNKLTTKFFDVAVFISLDLVLIFSSFSHVSDFVWKFPPKESDSIRVQVMPQQWVWNFRYPGLDNEFGTADDIVTVNDLRVPKGKPVIVQLKSKDVIHGFMIPNVRIQIDALPGSVTKFWFDTNREGDFEIACYHHCGTAHYKMKAFLKVMSENDFKAWSEEQSQWAQTSYDPEDKLTHWGWVWRL